MRNGFPPSSIRRVNGRDLTISARALHGHSGADENSDMEFNVRKKTTGWEIVKKMLSYVWPKDNTAMKARVAVAMALLLGSKASLAKNNQCSEICGRNVQHGHSDNRGRGSYNRVQSFVPSLSGIGRILFVLTPFILISGVTTKVNDRRPSCLSRKILCGGLTIYCAKFPFIGRTPKLNIGRLNIVT